MVVGHWIRIGPVFQQGRDHVGVSSVGGKHQCGLSAFRFDILISLMVQQNAHSFGMTTLRRKCEGRPSIIGRLTIYLRPRVEQKANNLFVS